MRKARQSKARKADLFLMTPDQFAKGCGITRRQLQNLVSEGIIPKLGRRLEARFGPSAMDWFALYRWRLAQPHHDCKYRMRLEQLLECRTADEFEAFEGRELADDRIVLPYCEARYDVWAAWEGRAPEPEPRIR